MVKKGFLWYVGCSYLFLALIVLLIIVFKDICFDESYRHIIISLLLIVIGNQYILYDNIDERGKK